MDGWSSDHRLQYDQLFCCCFKSMMILKSIHPYTSCIISISIHLMDSYWMLHLTNWTLNLIQFMMVSVATAVTIIMVHSLTSCCVLIMFCTLFLRQIIIWRFPSKNTWFPLLHLLLIIIGHHSHLNDTNGSIHGLPIIVMIAHFDWNHLLYTLILSWPSKMKWRWWVLKETRGSDYYCWMKAYIKISHLLAINGSIIENQTTPADSNHCFSQN